VRRDAEDVEWITIAGVGHALVHGGASVTLSYARPADLTTGKPPGMIDASYSEDTIWRLPPMAAKSNGKVRDTRTGQYVKKEEAQRRPATTVTERDKGKK
jgi:hypothetical protein